MFAGPSPGRLSDASHDDAARGSPLKPSQWAFSSRLGSRGSSMLSTSPLPPVRLPKWQRVKRSVGLARKKRAMRAPTCAGFGGGRRFGRSAELAEVIGGNLPSSIRKTSVATDMVRVQRHHWAKGARAAHELFYPGKCTARKSNKLHGLANGLAPSQETAECNED